MKQDKKAITSLGRDGDGAGYTCTRKLDTAAPAGTRPSRFVSQATRAGGEMLYFISLPTTKKYLSLHLSKAPLL